MGEREILQARAQERGMAFVDLERVRIDPAALATMPAELMRELRALPVRRDGKTLWLVLDAFDPAAVDKVKGATGLRVIPALCVPAELDAALARLAPAP